MARAEDPRPARTRAAIAAALTRLSEAGHLLSVAAVAAEAGISRSTFYGQYRDLDDLAVQTLAETFSEIEALDLRLRVERGPADTAQATTHQLVVAFDRRRALYAAVLSSAGAAAAEQSLRDAFAEAALETLRRTAPADVDPHGAAVYIAGGSIALLATWLRSDEPSTADVVQQQLIALLPPWLMDADQSTPTPERHQR